jgi:hypothetical protein
VLAEKEMGSLVSTHLSTGCVQGMWVLLHAFERLLLTLPPEKCHWRLDSGELKAKGMISLIFALQLIWDELGEIDADRDKQLLAIEEECLQVSLVTHAFLRSHGPMDS